MAATNPAAPPAGGGLRLASPAGRWTLACTVLASGAAMLDGSIVTIALPRIGRDLHAPLAVLQWISNAYMLTLAGLILLGGGLGDRYGRRRVFLLGTGWFAAASVLCAAAPGSGTLVAARALQGIGAALLTPGSLALLQATFRPDDRARAVGAWSGLGGVATAVAPFLGGWLVDGPGWRWIFLINVPVAAAVAVIALRHVPESRDEQATGDFDTTGAALAALALGGATYALTAAPDGATAPAVLVPGTAALLLGVLFIPFEHRVEAAGRTPMLPPGIFAARQFSGLNAVTLCLYAAIGGTFFLLPVQLQNGLGYSALDAGVATLPVTLLMLGLSARSGALARRIGPRIPLTAGPLIAAVGLLLMRRITPGAPYATAVLPATCVLGLGMAAFVAPLTASVLASVDVRRAGLASGVNNAAARAAQLIAVAALPAAAGLSGSAYDKPAAVDAAFHRAAAVCAALMVGGALLALVTVRRDVLAPGGPGHAEPHCRTVGTPTVPPLEPGD